MLRPGRLVLPEVQLRGEAAAPPVTLTLTPTLTLTRLLQLGSTALLELGLADDQDDLGLDQTLAPWLEALRARLLVLRPMAKGLAPIPRSQSLPPRYRLLEGEAFPVGEPAPPPSVPPAVDGPPSQAHPFYARLV